MGVAHVSVRITQGQLKNRNIKVPDMDDLRPVPQMAREAIFNRLMNDLTDKSFLDLFAGSGIMGFEALSRGAKHVTWIEKEKCLCQKIREHHERFCEGLNTGEGIVSQAEIKIPDMSLKKFDIVFADPPFNQPQWIPLLIDCFDKSEFLTPEGCFILKTPKFYPLSMRTSNMVLKDSRNYGGVSLFWFEAK